jgi:hypothetical protein
MKSAIIIALAATLGSATLAAADTSYFGIDRLHGDTARVDLGTVRSATDGVIELYDFNNGTVGELLGTTEVSAGANSHVNIVAPGRLINDVYAVLKADNGAVLADKEIDVRY